MYKYFIWKNGKVVKDYKNYKCAAKAYNRMLYEDVKNEHCIWLDSRDGSVFLENGERAKV